MKYSAFFNVADARHNLGSITFRTAGEDYYVISIRALSTATRDGSHQTTVFGHHSVPSFTDENGDILYNVDFSIAQNSLAGEMTARMQAFDWPSSLELVCEFDGLRYTFRYTGHTFTQIMFSNIETRRLFGFGQNFTGPAAMLVHGDRLPNFILSPVLSAITMEQADGYPYEPEGIATAAMNMGGMQFGLTRPLTPRYRNWVQQAEPRARVLRDSAATTAPFTHQLLFESCRSVLPFAVINGLVGDGHHYLFRLRPSGCMWDLTSCKRNGGETDSALFDVHYRVQQLAAFAGTWLDDEAPPDDDVPPDDGGGLLDDASGNPLLDDNSGDFLLDG